MLLTIQAAVALTLGFVLTPIKGKSGHNYGSKNANEFAEQAQMGDAIAVKMFNCLQRFTQVAVANQACSAMHYESQLTRYRYT